MACDNAPHRYNTGWGASCYVHVMRLVVRLRRYSPDSVDEATPPTL